VARSIQDRQAPHQPELRRHGACEVVGAQAPATTHSRGQYPPSFNVTRRVEGGQVAHRNVRLVINPSSVGMVPVRSLQSRSLRHHSRGQNPPSFNPTRRGGRQEAHIFVTLFINPSSVGMVPVRSLCHRALQPPTPEVSTHHRSTRHAGWRVEEAYSHVRLVINPSSVGMVPVSPRLPRLSRYLRPPTPTRPATQRRRARHGLAHAARGGEGRAAYMLVQPAGLLMQVWYSLRSSMRTPYTLMRQSSTSITTSIKFTMNSMMENESALPATRAALSPHTTDTALGFLWPCKITQRRRQRVAHVPYVAPA
jgi:hypothetical protein